MIRGTKLTLQRDYVVARGWSQIAAIPTPPPGAPADAGNRPIAYRLEGGFNGGFDPRAPHCASWSYGDRTPTADCIGFVLWASGIDRMQPGYKGTRGEWLNCASILDDAKGPRVYCELVGDDEDVVALPGDWLVTPDHIGLIVRPANATSGVLVIDCSPRHRRDAAINTGYAWSDACQVVRPKFYAP